MSGLDLTVTYQAHSGADCREGIQHIHGRVEPFHGPIMASPGLVEPRDLISQQVEDSMGGITVFEFENEWI